MYQQRSYSDQLTFFQKIKNFDILLILSVLILGFVGVISMYSSDGGQFSYHTKSHIIRFLVFFSLMIILSFVRIKFWHAIGYLFYFFVVLLLIYASLYGANVILAKEKNLKASVDEILKKVTNKTKIVFIANPNNPTGTYLKNYEILKLRKKLRNNILLVVDDAYDEYMQKKDYTSGLKLFKNSKNVIVLRPFSTSL